ncbi:MAG TPA: gluconate 2-dehydrogenase subunit 3 family protein [Gemmatimonadales bacterium]|nr:gluconate 2-dehydrogenase subunit 3 family protein [Gemmatimonadales bacterium]
MSHLDRRELLQLLAASPIPALLGVPPAAVERAVRAAQATPAPQDYQPRFFTPDEWRTVAVLSDLIVPRDERSGSATDARVPEFIDYVLAEWPDNQTPVRGGLAWLDRECRERFGAPFAGCTAGQQTELLDAIAYPKRAAPEMSQGVAFFNRFRDLVLSGFWSSKVGVEDLRYMGNTFVTEWKGCPAEVTAKLGVR